MLGQTTTRKHETWNNSSDSSYQYNRTDHSDWDHSYTDDYGVQYEADGFTHHQQSSHSDSNRLDIGNRTTTTGSMGTSVSGSRTIDNSANGGWDSTYNSRSFDKTTWPGDPYGGDSWELSESTGHSTGNVAWSFAENDQTDYATGITTGTTTSDPYGGNPASGGGHDIGKYRHAHNDGHGNSSDSGLQTMYEYWWSADESHYGQAPGKRAGLQTMPARSTGGGPEGEGKGTDLLAQAGSALGNMMGSIAATASEWAGGLFGESEETSDGDGSTSASGPTSPNGYRYVSTGYGGSQDDNGKPWHAKIGPILNGIMIPRDRA